MHINELRFHHLFCVPQFVGKGYSNEFSANMQKIRDFLYDCNPYVNFVCGCDCICENCPNKSETGCLLDGQNENSGVDKRDEEISRLAGIKDGDKMLFSEALDKVFENTEKSDFDRICGDCRWYKQGLCSYENWKENLKVI